MKKCYVCFDTGIVKYTKTELGNEYDFYAHCICDAGNNFKCSHTDKKGKIILTPCIDRIFDMQTLENISNSNREMFAEKEEKKKKDEIFGFKQVQVNFDEIKKIFENCKAV
jgi:hypothetical protein